jgi:hypothetical protein
MAPCVSHKGPWIQTIDDLYAIKVRILNGMLAVFWPLYLNCPLVHIATFHFQFVQNKGEKKKKEKVKWGKNLSGIKL